MRRIAAVVLLVAALGLISGCDWLLRDKTEKHYEVGGGVHTVSVTGTAVDLDVVAGKGPISVDEIIRYNGDVPETGHQVRGGVLTLDSDGCTAGKACRVRYRVTVPATVAVQADLDAGTIETTGLSGRLALRLGAGQVTAHRALSRSADVRVDVGDVDLRYAAVPDRVAVTSSTGAVEVTLPGQGPYAVTTRIDVGQNTVKVPSVPGAAHAVDVRVDVGQITVSPA
ncbi:hypothetical protein [Cryptosporangium phraense]|uniref:DUF4097 domain-containing protein n=1 Tax=Cryptosporangium phraense TaxID=2593070 RepID=A0A545AEX7_9ACTN|nr:hypothetical protein [Cryptosporangium phraense]TQS39888.1 hypothetical protein FL583_37745 [Cryptosporangium phraense]